jgi:hypothetical protein
VQQEEDDRVVVDVVHLLLIWVEEEEISSRVVAEVHRLVDDIMPYHTRRRMIW